MAEITPLPLPDMIKLLDEQEAALLASINKQSMQLSQVRAARAALLALQNEEPIEFDGKLADAIRAVLKNHGGNSLAPLQVRDEVQKLGYDLRRHSNPMASIHSVLKRLADSGEVKTKVWSNQPGTRYYWNVPEAGTPPPSLAEMEDSLKRLAQLTGTYQPPPAVDNAAVREEVKRRLEKLIKK